jgi:plastocyanin
MDGRTQAGIEPVRRIARRTFLRRAGVGALIVGSMATSFRTGMVQASSGLASESQTSIGSPPPAPGASGAEAPDPESRSTTVKIELAVDRGIPPEVNVPCQSTITWVNRGTEWTRVASLDGEFDSGRIAPGDAFKHRFEHPGSHQYMFERPAGRGKSGRINVV